MKRIMLALTLLALVPACSTDDSTERTRSCTEAERLEYATTVLSRVFHNWEQPQDLAGVTCLIRVKQNREGEVLGVAFQDCPDEEDVRDSLIAAVAKAQPLPQPGNPTCFNEMIEVSIEPYSD